MEQKHYEAVFILTPVLSEDQMKDTVQKFDDFLQGQGADIYHKENWGLKKLAYPIQSKKTGFYQLFEFTASGEAISNLETEFRRDERVIRFLVVKLDKYGVQFNTDRRAGKFKKEHKQKEETTA